MREIDVPEIDRIRVRNRPVPSKAHDLPGETLGNVEHEIAGRGTAVSEGDGRRARRSDIERRAAVDRHRAGIRRRIVDQDAGAAAVEPRNEPAPGIRADMQGNLCMPVFSDGHRAAVVADRGACIEAGYVDHIAVAQASSAFRNSAGEMGRILEYQSTGSGGEDHVERI